MSHQVEKRLFIKTYGCQMNAYDSQRIADVLAPHGYKTIETPEGADVIVLNTCHIREKAAEKVFSDLGRLKPLKQARAQFGQDTFIIVAGCVAQAEAKEIPKRAPYVDIVLGPQTYHRLPKMLEEATQNRAKEIRKAIIDTEFPVEVKFDHLPAPQNLEGFSAFISIQEGCDKFCTFCVVPYTRGAEYSRPVNDIVLEAQNLAKQGIREITLLGQNVTAYHGAAPNGQGEWSIASLILKIADIEGIDRIRYTTSHPRDIASDLIATHGSCEKLMPFLHLPVQSGSDRILKAMNRQHTAAEYNDIIERLRQSRPDIGFSSDFIVGFPGESDTDFQDTLKLIDQTQYAQAYSFKYSPRPGTPASLSDDHVAEAIKIERLKILQDAIQRQQQDFNTKTIGQTLPVLFEKRGKKENQYIGRSPYMQSIHSFFTQDIIGKICHIKVTGAYQNSLAGDATIEDHEKTI